MPRGCIPRQTSVHPFQRALPPCLVAAERICVGNNWRRVLTDTSGSSVAPVAARPCTMNLVTA